MATAYDSSIMGGSPYYNDFDAQKKYLQVLFKPGFPVQARELSQAQSILQNQIQRFGDHIFDNGSVVLGGGVSEVAATFLRIDSGSELSDANLQNIIGQRLRGTSNDVITEAKVVAVSEKSELTNDNYQVLFIQYLTPGEFTEGQTLSTVGTGNIGVSFSVLAGQTAPGVGAVSNFISLNEGIFYIDGYFSLVDAQAFAAYNTNTNEYRDYGESTVSVGLVASKSVVSVETDPSLRDPSFGFSNFNAPGADRYKLELNLNQRGLTGSEQTGFTISDDTNFFELARIIEGKTTRKVKYPDYAELEKTLARRTFDESGHYTVDPFELEVDTYEDTFGIVDTSKFGVKLSPGKAYVKGYEYESISTTKLENDFPTTTVVITEFENVPFGSYIELVDAGGEGTLTAQQKLNFSTGGQQIFLKHQRMYLYTFDGVTYNKVGHFTPIFLTTDESGGKIRIYISEVQRTASDQVVLASTTNVAQGLLNDIIGSAEYFYIRDPQPGAIDDSNIVQSGSSSRLVDISEGGATKTLNPVNLPYIRPFKTRTDGTGSATITLGAGRRFAGIQGNKQGARVGPHAYYRVGTGLNPRFTRIQNFTLDETNGAMTFTLPQVENEFANLEVILFAPVANVQSTAIRTKTLSGNITQTGIAITNGRLQLNDADVQGIVSVTNDSTSTTDLIEDFVFDDGQRDSVYERASLTLKRSSSQNRDGENYTVVYKRFVSSGDDGPYVASSYASVDRADIPSFNGKLLTNFIDYRPKVNTSGDVVSINYATASLNDNCNPINEPDDDQIETVEAILGRIDSVILTQDREFAIIRGVPALDPQPPQISSNDLELYRLRIPRDVRSVDDIRIEYIDTQRFTMEDIGVLEDTQYSDANFNYKRILVSDTVARANANSFDQVALSGVFVEDFAGHGNADLTRDNYNVSIDPLRNSLTPAFVSSSITPTTSGTQPNATYFENKAATVETSDNILLPSYTENSFVRETINTNQTSEQINPFGAVDYYGTLKVTPFCINYWSETRKPKVFANPSGQLNNWEFATVVRDDTNQIAGRNRGFGTTWRDWELHWFGFVQNETRPDEVNPDDRIYKLGVRQAFVTRVLTQRLTKKIKNRIVDFSIKPYIPEATISLQAEALRPGSTVYAFLDDQMIGLNTGYTVDDDGTLDINITIDGDTFTVGRKQIFLMDNVNGNLGTSTTSADAYFYAERNFDTRIDNISHVRPPIVKRQSATSNKIEFDSYDDLFDQEQSVVLNSLSPIMQRFTVRPEAFAHGMFLTKVDLYFNGQVEAGTPVIASISPVYDDVPITTISMPLSEKVISETTQASVVDGEVTGATTVTFDTPIYLPPGKDYVLKLESNDLDVSLFTRSSISAEENPVGSLYLPQNNGENVAYNDRHLNVVFYHAVFDTETESSGQLNNSAPFVADSLYLSNNPIINSGFRNTITLNDGIEVRENATNIVNQLRNGADVASRTFGSANLTFNLFKTAQMSSIVDAQQVSLLASEIKINDARGGAPFFDITAELESVDLNGPGLARYYSKIIEIDNNTPADDVAVFIDGTFGPSTRLYVYLKPLGVDFTDTLEEAEFFQLFVGGNASSDLSIAGTNSLTFSTFKGGQAPEGFTPKQIRNTDGTSRFFNRYLIKVIISDLNGDLTDGEPIPTINFIASAPLRQAASVGFIPAGGVIPFAGVNANAPTGFVYCDGTEYSEGELPALFSAIGRTYGGDSVAGTFKVPDLRGKMPLGVGTVGDTNRAAGSSGGSNKLQGHRHHLLSDEGTGSGESRTFSGSGSEGPFNRTIAPNRTGDGEKSYRLGTDEVDGVFPDATKAVSSDAIDVNSLNAETAEIISDNTLTEQMPPYLVVNYIIKT